MDLSPIEIMINPAQVKAIPALYVYSGLPFSDVEELTMRDITPTIVTTSPQIDMLFISFPSSLLRFVPIYV